MAAPTSPPADWPSVRPFLVGERLNALGSHRCRQSLLDDDYDGLIAIAREQLERGAHGLDVCVTLDLGSGSGEQGSGIGDQKSARRPALPPSHEATAGQAVDDWAGPTESDRMIALVTRLADAVSVPLFIDSANPAVLQTALPSIGARGVANSVTLANGERDLETLAPVVREHGARLVVLCIDEEGMAVSTSRKLAIVHRLRRVAERLELHARSLLIDPLTFPVAIGPSERRRGAGETIAAIRQIKNEWPEVQTILGISDVSFGLPAALRPILNAVFLHHAVEAGLDCAIANVITRREYGDLSPQERELAEDLLFDRTPDALDRFTAAS